MKPTRHQDINEILHLLKTGLINIFDKNLVGLYLTGSLTYDDFNRGSSDIDFLAVLKNTLSKEQLKKVKRLHSSIGKSYPKWRKRIEGSYVTKKMLSSTKPPKQSRPYFNADKMWDLVYENEWVMELDELYKHGISLVGPNPRKLIKPVDTSDVRKASRKNLLENWQPKLKNPAIFNSADYDSSHLQVYAVIIMCRILHIANNENIASKKIASAWAKKTYGKQWGDLIEKAENWKHGQEMNSQEEIKKFIRFVISTIEKK